jgi:hypothetical protein
MKLNGVRSLMKMKSCMVKKIIKQVVKCDYCKRECECNKDSIIVVCKCGNIIEVKGGERR